MSRHRTGKLICSMTNMQTRMLSNRFMLLGSNCAKPTTLDCSVHGTGAHRITCSQIHLHCAPPTTYTLYYASNSMSVEAMSCKVQVRVNFVSRDALFLSSKKTHFQKKVFESDFFRTPNSSAMRDKIHTLDLDRALYSTYNTSFHRLHIPP